MKTKPKSNRTGRSVATVQNALPLRLTRIRVTTDFSDESKKALTYAAAFAKRLGAEVALLHMLEAPPRFVGFLPTAKT
jgi:hypothetical protein